MKATPLLKVSPGPIWIWPLGPVMVTGAMHDHEPSGFLRNAAQTLLTFTVVAPFSGGLITLSPAPEMSQWENPNRWAMLFTMSFQDLLNLHVLLGAFGFLVSVGMSIHSLELAKQGKKWRLIWSITCALIFIGIAIDGAIEHHNELADKTKREATDIKRDQAQKDLKTALDASLKSLEALKLQITQLSADVIQRNQGKSLSAKIPKQATRKPSELPATSPPTPQASPPISVEVPKPTISTPITGESAQLRLTQENVVSTDSKNPYALRVIVQTDTTIHNPDFALLCDGSVGHFEFFVIGQGVMMNVRRGTLSALCGVRLAFSFPDFTPDSPISVMIYSDQKTRIISLVDARGSPW